MGTAVEIEVGQTWQSKAPSARDLWLTVVRKPRDVDMVIVRREPNGSEYPMVPETIRANYELVSNMTAGDVADADLP